MGHTRTQADKLAETLRSLPSARVGLSNKMAMVSYLRAEIIGLQERGYTIAAIATALRAGGFEIAASTLRNYLAQLKRRGRRKARGRRRTPAPAAASSVLN
jgi:hypothetical protein